jgi:hypothetical protein
MQKVFLAKLCNGKVESLRMGAGFLFTSEGPWVV